ncbi:tetratricopeptide repeat protein [Flammeovirga sp. MY04]|uniref:tetratricopeptide repeat protein n=1 Tax=Flammeovirga sp. MY04 TaxID=1191459 RepID=UPI0008268148|nr:tetratricopeptide repeat protein [Flammeovirga sp. MY04]ANQ50653.2 tetratricopeptide repeat protein [Flammeovirga sp. MY04]
MKEKKQKVDKGNTHEEHKEYEVFESAEVLQERIVETQGFLDKNKNSVIGLVAAVVVIVAAYFLYGMNMESENAKAQAALSPAVFYFEKDSLNKALNGDVDANTVGFLAVADEYSGTKAANLANYYAGVSYMKMGEFEKAIDHLEKFSSKDLLVQARAYALVGDAYVQTENFDAAISSYKDAVNYKENDDFTPAYLMKLAFAYEAKGDVANAKSTYEAVISDYAKSQVVNDAKKYLALLNTQG